MKQELKFIRENILILKVQQGVGEKLLFVSYLKGQQVVALIFTEFKTPSNCRRIQND